MSPKFHPQLNTKLETRFESTIQHLPYVISYFLNYAFRACPISPRPLIKKSSATTDKINDHNDYPPYHIPHKKHTVSYFTSLTLISEPPTFLTRGGGYQGLTTGRNSVLR
jgi:hypothetical protein